MNNQLTQTNNNAIQERLTQDTVGKFIASYEKQFRSMLPSHITPERMMRLTTNCIRNNPKLLECTKESLISAVLKSVQLGLEADGVMGLAYLIPYDKSVNIGGQWKKIKECQFQIGYKGILELVRRSGEATLDVQLVYEKDLFEIDFSSTPQFTHKPYLQGHRGEIIGCWARAKYTNGRGEVFEFMSKYDIDNVRDTYSQAYKNAKTLGGKKLEETPWVQNYGTMARKTLVTRIQPFLPMSVQKAIEVDNLAEKGKKFEIIDGDIILDNEQEVKKPAVNAVSALEAAAQPAQAFDTATGEIIDNDTETSPVEADAPAEEAKPFLTMSEIVALPYTNQTQIKELCKQAGRSIENGTIEKMEFFLTFPDLPDAAKKTGAYPAFEKLTKL
jgi:recombination protein RecT